LPLEWDVEDVLALVDALTMDSATESTSANFSLLGMAAVMAVRGGAGLDGEDGDALAVDSVRRPARKAEEAGLRGAVKVVGLRAAVAGYRGDDARVPAWRWTQKLASQVRSETGP